MEFLESVDESFEEQKYIALKTAVCTISTQSHLFKSQALLDSLMKYSQADLFCLVTDVVSIEKSEFFQVNLLSDLKSDAAVAIQNKYSGDKLRWALKPVYLRYLLDKGYDQVIYVDNDVFFYSSPAFLFDKLQSASFLLTPHFYEANPQQNQNWLEANYRVGLYNAGFIGVSQKGIEILDWWANCCLYNLKKAFWRGLFDDQKYLDLIPVLFDEVEIIKHKGCNLAGWNYQNHLLTRDYNQQLLVNGESLVFIHFAALSMNEFFKKGNQIHLEYEVYVSALKVFNRGFEFKQSKFEKRNVASFLYYLRWCLVRKFEK